MTADRTRRGGSTPSELASGRPHQSLAGEPWGGLSEPLQRLSRNTVLVSNATANESGRLGGGQRALVALTESGTGWGEIPHGYEVVENAIMGRDRLGLGPLRRRPAGWPRVGAQARGKTLRRDLAARLSGLRGSLAETQPVLIRESLAHLPVRLVPENLGAR